MYFVSEEITFVLKRLHSLGYEAFLVGGFVRDIIMNKEPHDTDITTNALPEEVKNAFFDCKVIETGIKHGTVTVLCKNIPVEVTTYRIERGYSDTRHPDSVEFTNDIEKDLSRRDFTMNSIAYNPKAGFVDPFSGKTDIKNGIIRCVGNSETRFKEDALRILRAIRFSSCLGFEIEEETEKAMFLCKDLLLKLSAERIFSELVKMLCGKNIKTVLIKYYDILTVILPEIKGMKGFDQRNFHHRFDILEHTAVTVENIEPTPHLRLAALFHDCAKVDCFDLIDGVGHFYKHCSFGAKKADTALLRLKSDTDTREKVVKLIKLHDTPIELCERIIKKKLRSIGKDLFFDLIALQRSDNLAQATEFLYRQKHFDKIIELTNEILASNECFSLKNLAINGHDLISLGLKGKEIGTALEFLLSSVIDKKVANEKEALIGYYKENG